jgi:hypothetical protein
MMTVAAGHRPERAIADHDPAAAPAVPDSEGQAVLPSVAAPLAGSPGHPAGINQAAIASLTLAIASPVTFGLALPVPDPDADSTQFEAAVRQGVALACQQYEDEVLALTAEAVDADLHLRARRRHAEMLVPAIPTIANAPASHLCHLFGPNRSKFSLQGNLYQHGDAEPEPPSPPAVTEGRRIIDAAQVRGARSARCW